MHIYGKFFALLFLGILLLTGCTQKSSASLTDTYVYAMDTVITLRLPKNTDTALISSAEEKINTLESRLSKTIKNSDVCRFHDALSSIEIADDTKAVLKIALEVAAASNGAYDPTIAPLAALWDITGKSISSDPHVPAHSEIEKILPVIGYQKVILTENTLSKLQPEIELDLGGCAKGYACEEIVDFFKSSGITQGLISFGGNIGIIGHKTDGTPWRIGIKHPDKTNEIAGYLLLDSGFISVSGDYERYFETNGIRYHHIFDAKTGYPATSGIRSVAVFAENGTYADALSTALFVLGTEKSLALYERHIFSFEAVFYTADGNTVVTPGIADRYEHAAADIAPPNC